MVRCLAVALALMSSSCSYDAAKSTAPAKVDSDKSSESTPTKDELLTYLHGKQVEFERPSQGKDKKITFSIDRAKITALELGTNSFKANDEPWHSSCTFIYDAGADARYAVEAEFEHRKVANKRAFFSLHVKRVAEQ
jgi:hypothetical protein